MPASKSSSREKRKAKSPSRAARTSKARTKPANLKSRAKTAKRRSVSVSRKSEARSASRPSAALARMAKKAGDLAVEQIVPGDATELLEQDHREVEALFEQFEHLKGNSEKSKVAAKICLALTVHAQVEEELIYPLARKELKETDLVDEAEVEHAAAKQLIAEIERMSPRDKLFDAKVKVLGEYVKHHVHEEENDLFPKMREEELDFYKLGKKLGARKTALLITLAK